MRPFRLLGFCYFLLTCTLVSGKDNDAVHIQRKTIQLANLKALDVEKQDLNSNSNSNSSPILAENPIEGAILNVPPKLRAHKEEEHSPATDKELTTRAEKPVTGTQKKANESISQGETDKLGSVHRQTDIKPKSDVVTGLVTKSGSIYEIEDKDGIGIIESRQTPGDEDLNVCNYGSIVVYSDVPCEEVTNVHVGEVFQTTLKDGQSNQSDQSEASVTPNQNQHDQQQQQQSEEHQESINNSDELLNDVEKVKPPRRRGNNGQKRRRAQQNNQIRRRGNKKRSSSNRQRISPNRPNQQKVRSQQANKQKRRRQEQNRRRRLQNSQNLYPSQRRKNTNRNRNQLQNSSHSRPRHRHRNSSTVRNGNGNGYRDKRRNQRLQPNKRRRQHEYRRQRIDNEYEY